MNIPRELIDSIRKKECIAFVASGISSNVKRSNGKILPSWTLFLTELLEFALNKGILFNSDPEEIREMIEKENLLMAAEELQEVINYNHLSEFLNLVFRDKDVKPHKIHRDLTKIPFRAFLTTNYDNLLEGAFAIENDGKLPKSFTKDELDSAITLIRSKQFFIFKMHGDLDKPKSIILGSRSYQNILHKSPEYLSFLETLFTTNTILFLGFGGSDPDLDYILERLSTIFSRSINTHYLLAPNNKFNFTEKRRMLLDKRLKVIEYDPKGNHKQVGQFIAKLSAHVFFENNSIDRFEDEIIKVALVSDFGKDTIRGLIEGKIEATENMEITHWTIFEHFLDSGKPISSKESIESDKQKGIYSFLPDVVVIIIGKESLDNEEYVDKLDAAILKQIENDFKIILITDGSIKLPFRLARYRSVQVSGKPNPDALNSIIYQIKTMANM